MPTGRPLRSDAPRSVPGKPADSPGAVPIICFAEGTFIRTPHGERRIEALRPGDSVLTLDRGAQPVRWIGRKTVSASGALAPVRFAPGAAGNYRDLFVSPEHRMLLTAASGLGAWTAPDEVLAPALALVDDLGVSVAYGGMVTYHHMLFDRHEVVFANGAPGESFHPGEDRLDGLAEASREELFRLFPNLRANAVGYGPASRPCLRAAEARTLVRL